MIQLRQHAVEAAHQATELVARVPARPQSVVTGRADAVSDIGEPAHRKGDLARDEKHDAEDQEQEAGGGAEVDPHALEQLVEA